MLKKILKIFREISQIPRCSYKEEKILAFFVEWAKKKEFKYKIDSAQNIIIYVPATSGKESDETIILQWHMDMVCVKDNDSNHDFCHDPIEIIEENWWIRANKTTLWADNWIGLAIALYLSEIPNHPKLEILITNREEVGLFGANLLEEKYLSWKKLINIDTEELWEICVSSAGGRIIKISGDYSLKKDDFFQCCKLFIGGMKWGHSWLEIDKNRGNIIYNFFEFLKDFRWNIQIHEIKWGVADNAIPKEMEIIFSSTHIKNIKIALDLWILKLKKKYDAPSINYTLTKNPTKAKTSISKKELTTLSEVICWNPVWVQGMSSKINWLVQTSNNLWEILVKDWKISIIYMSRSSHFQDLENIAHSMSNSCKETFLSIKIGHSYPWWEENPKSSFVQEIKALYQKEHTAPIKTMAYHAGLECWAIIAKLWEEAQALSIWPEITWAHTTKEKCNIESIKTVVKTLKKYLEK